MRSPREPLQLRPPPVSLVIPPSLTAPSSGFPPVVVASARPVEPVADPVVPAPPVEPVADPVVPAPEEPAVEAAPPDVVPVLSPPVVPLLPLLVLAPPEVPEVEEVPEVAPFCLQTDPELQNGRQEGISQVCPW